MRRSVRSVDILPRLRRLFRFTGGVLLRVLLLLFVCGIFWFAVIGLSLAILLVEEPFFLPFVAISYLGTVVAVLGFLRHEGELAFVLGLERGSPPKSR